MLGDSGQQADPDAISQSKTSEGSDQEMEPDSGPPNETIDNGSPVAGPAKHNSQEEVNSAI